VTILYTSNSSLFRLLGNALVFLVILSVPIAYTEYRLRHNLNNDYVSYKNKYDEMFRDKTGSDVIIMGTSHGAHGIIPDIVKMAGHSTYNFCLDGAAPSFNYDLYTRVISIYYAQPRLVIYDVSSFMFDSRRLGRTFSSDYKFMPLSVGFCGPDNHSGPLIMPYEYLRITHEQDLYKALTNSYKDKKLDNLQIEKYDNGFIPNEKKFTAHNQPFPTVNAPKEIKSFDNFIQLLLSHNISVVFVETPDYAPEVKDIGVVKKNNLLISSFAKKHSIPFLNYNEELKSDINGDKKYFSDQDHLNYLGARTFSGMLAADLQKLPIAIAHKLGSAELPEVGRSRIPAP
jgi:hypothetical protein